jgi:hypothetical protein
VGERPAAAGADTGVVDWKASIRGVVTAWESLGFVVGMVLRLKRDGLEADTSSSKADRFLFPTRSIRFGSTFSESECSGEAARRFKVGVDDGVIASKVNGSELNLLGYAYRFACS